jgi:hypothetical protein
MTGPINRGLTPFGSPACFRHLPLTHLPGHNTTALLGAVLGRRPRCLPLLSDTPGSPAMRPTRFHLIGVLAILTVAGWTAWATACPFCSMQGQTLTGDVGQASMVLFGTLKDPRLNNDGTGTTDLHIEAVVKKHDILGDKKVLTLPRYVRTDDKKYLIFCDVFKGKVDPYRGVPVEANSDIVKYLTGALAVKDKDNATRLRFFFDFLDNADLEIANDAYKEFGNADYKDYKEMAKQLPAERIVKWLQDAKTPTFRFGLYASMLGHCGTEKDAEVLHQLLDDPKKRVSSGLDGVMAGYIMLKPKEGWSYLVGVLKDTKKDFLFRYAGLRAVRFLLDQRADVLPKSDLVQGVLPLLEQSDIADLAMEDLRKWKSWETLDKVLALSDKESHNIPIIRRAILRFALSCPGDKAAEYVTAMRKKDGDWVKEVEELLRLESTPSK